MLESAILIISVLLSILIGWFVVSRNPRILKHQLYGLLTVALISFSVFNYLSLTLGPNTLLYIRMVMVSSTFGIALIYLLTLTMYPSVNERTRRRNTKLMLVSTCTVAVLSMTPLVFSGLAPSTSFPTPIANWGIVIFIIHLTVTAALTCLMLFIGARKLRKKTRRQFTLMQIGVLPILVGAPITSIILPVFLNVNTLIVFSPLYPVFYLLMIGYAIVRHGLFDIRLVVVRTLAYILSLSTLAILYGIFAFQIVQELFGYRSSTTENVVNIAMALVLAFIFQPVKRFFDRVTNRIFFKDQYDTNDFVGRLSDVLTTTTDLRTLLHRAATEIGTTLKSEQAFFYLRYAGDRYISAGTKDYKTLSLDEFEVTRRFMSENNHEIIIADTMPGEHEATKILKRRSIAVMMPIVRGKDIFGYFALGESRSSGYKERDIRAIETVSGALLIAIQNSLSAQEVRELNVHLQERIKEATNELTKSNAQLKKLDKSKDEFLSLASHQLRTPLTSIKGYLSMVLEGDLGSISKEQEKALSQSFGSAQRMVFLINDFLNVSRLQTGKFEIEKKEVDLAKLTGEEVAQLKDTAKSKQITIEYKAPIDLAPIQADANKLRQVIMNFIDNALYYSPAGTTVRVLLQREAESLVLKVIDAGMGVPAAEQANLFSKFFRATNARKQRPDGTGIGLYMAKKVIVGHGGTVVFESAEGKGSTFGFSLPIEVLGGPKGEISKE